MKGNFIKYCKSFGIIAGATVTLYGGFKLLDSVVQLVPAVEKIQTEQTDIKEILIKVQEEQKSQKEEIGGITESIITYYKSRPEITKEDLIRYVTPIYDELKKNGYMTQSTSSPVSGS